MVDPWGREVVFDYESWLHLAEGEHSGDAIANAVALLIHHAHDPLAGREKLAALGSSSLRATEAQLAPALKSAA